eukprot:15358549-Ditylum_brightwellii.AAC.1
MTKRIVTSVPTEHAPIGEPISDLESSSKLDDVVIVDKMNNYYDVCVKESNLYLLLDMYGKEHVSIYRGNMCDEAFMQQVSEETRPGWVCHMTARAGVRPLIQDLFVYIHSNIKGTTWLMELSHQYGI